MQDNHLLQLYKAAAGSGKTYTLTQEYLRHILRPSTQVRNILAITFTNAATADMKRKIIEALGDVVQGRYPDWKKLLGSKDAALLEIHPDKEAEILENLKQQALLKREMLLHQYQDFSVKTIDSFVQNLIKPFAFELGLPQNYTPSIELDALCDEITQRILDDCGLEGDPTLTGFLQAYLNNREEDEKSLNIKESIWQVVTLLFDESSIKAIDNLGHLSAEEFSSIIQRIRDYCQAIENLVEEAWKEANDCIRENGLEASDFHGGSRGIYLWFSKPADYGKYAAPSPTVIANVEKGILKNEAFRHLEPIFRKSFETLTSIQYKSYALLSEITRNIYVLGLLNHAREILDEIKESTSVIPISEFNRKIDEALSKEGNEFIFERSGTRYRHVFIDEFQDTSRLQWKNLRPLIENNLAQGNECLIVGDPKQSIYRFRNADLEQFVRLCANEGEVGVKVNTLRSNWRSDKGIIAFNNAFYHFIKEKYPFMPGPDDGVYEAMLEKQGKGELQDNGPEASKDNEGSRNPNGALTRLVFADHEQYYRNETSALPDKDPEAVRIIQARNMNGEFLDNWILEQTEKVLARHPSGEVAILCHKNRHCQLVADYLVKKGYKVATPDSLKLGKHPGLQLLVASLEYIDSHEEYHAAKTFTLARQLDLWPQISLSGGIHEEWVSTDCKEVLKAILRLGENQVDVYDTVESCLRFWQMDKHADQYILCFLDQVQKMQCCRLGQLVEWWNDKGKDTCISAAASQDSVQIMSIHKSKGLEFKVVILPFISDHRLDPSELFWTTGDNLSQEYGLPSALVRYIGKLSDTVVGNEIQKEKQRMEIDNLNALYVATTRPQHQLYIINHIPNRNSNAFASNLAIANFAASFPEYLEYEEDGGSLPEYISDSNPGTENENESPTLGKTAPSLTEPSSPAYQESYPMESQEWRKRYLSSCSTRKEETISMEQKWGLFIHKALSCLSDGNPTSVENSLESALLTYPEFCSRKEEASKILNEFCQHPTLAPYLDSSYLSKSETTLSVSPGKDLRPDRVCIKGKEAVVIDYKTGEARKEHITQVQEYMQELQKMKMETKGFLVYVGNDGLQVEKVEINA